MAGFRVNLQFSFQNTFRLWGSDDQVRLNIPLRYIVKASYSRHASCTNVSSHTLNRPDMKNLLTYIVFLGLMSCSDSEYYKVQFDNVDRLAEGDKVILNGLEV